jgi:hypothetical protein
MKRALAYAVAMGLFGALVGVGCGNSPDPNTDDTKSIALNSFMGEITKVQCARIFECCDAAERTKMFQQIGTVPKDEAQCASLLLSLATSSFQAETDAVKAGRQTYDGEKAKICINNLKNSLYCSADSVNDAMEEDPVCNVVFKGAVDEGGKCEDAGDCSAQSSACPSNTCVTLKANGAACTDSNDCASKYCDSDKLVCAARLAEGAGCEFDTDCQSESCDTATKKCVAAEALSLCNGM